MYDSDGIARHIWEKVRDLCFRLTNQNFEQLYLFITDRMS